MSHIGPALAELAACTIGFIALRDFLVENGLLSFSNQLGLDRGSGI